MTRSLRYVEEAETLLPILYDYCTYGASFVENHREPGSHWADSEMGSGVEPVQHQV